MSPTRRHAAIGLLAAAGAALPTAEAWGQAQPTEMPDEDDSLAEIDTRRSGNEHMLAPVLINGSGPYQFLLDTGANVSCVSSRLATKLALTPAAPMPVHTVVGVRERPTVMIDRLTVGPRKRRRVHAPSLPLDGILADGVLGVDWLKGQRLTLDFKGKQIEIARSQDDQAVPGKAVVVPARRRHGQLTIVDADLSGRPISAIIDSGAQSSLCNAKLKALVEAAERRKGLVPDPRYVKMESLAGEAFRGEQLFLPFLRLGGLHLGNVQVTYAEMHVFDIWGLKDQPALVIGMDLLSQFERVSLDFGRSAVRFEFT
jgi:predicted aspartyl protease